MGLAAKFVIPGVLFILTLVFGFWLSRSGKPYNGLIFNVHKLIALAAVIVTAIRAFNALKVGDAQPQVIVLLIVIGLCAVALFVTGALMSANKATVRATLTIHRDRAAAGGPRHARDAVPARREGMMRQANAGYFRSGLPYNRFGSGRAPRTDARSPHQPGVGIPG